MGPLRERMSVLLCLRIDKQLVLLFSTLSVMNSPGDSISSLVEYSDDERLSVDTSPIAAMGNNLSTLCNRSGAAPVANSPSGTEPSPAQAVVADVPSSHETPNDRSDRSISTDEPTSKFVSDATTTVTTDDPMVITRSRSRETQHQPPPPSPPLSPPANNVDMVDRRAVYYEIGGIRFPPPQSYDDVSNDDIIGIAATPWFSRCSVLAGAADNYEVLNLYSWDGQFFWGEDAACLRSRVWRELFATDDGDLNTRGSHAAKRAEHVKHIRQGLASLRHTPLIEDGRDVDLWRYRTYGEIPYVENLCGISQGRLAAWRNRFVVDEHALCWHRSILPSDFRYRRRADTDYWDTQIRLERRALSVMGRFVPYHLRCVWNLREHARDRLAVKIPESYAELAMPHGFRFEMEPLFSYKSGALIQDRDSGLWVVAYTERVVRICSGLLFDVYDTYRLWWVPPTVIAFARQLGYSMATALGSESNVEEVLELLDVVEATRFDDLPSSWRDRVTHNSNRLVDYHSGRRSATSDVGADFVYYDPWQRVKVSREVALNRAAAARVVPDDLPSGWDHVEADDDRPPRDAFRDFDPNVPPREVTPYYPVVEAPAAAPTTAASDVADAVVTIRRFLEEANILSVDDPVMTRNEMLFFVRGRMR